VVVNLFSVNYEGRRPFFCSFVNLSSRKKKNLQQEASVDCHSAATPCIPLQAGYGYTHPRLTSLLRRAIPDISSGKAINQFYYCALAKFEMVRIIKTSVGSRFLVLLFDLFPETQTIIAFLLTATPSSMCSSLP
jgi:hypothetical protein